MSKSKSPVQREAALNGHAKQQARRRAPLAKANASPATKSGVKRANANGPRKSAVVKTIAAANSLSSAAKRGAQTNGHLATDGKKIANGVAQDAMDVSDGPARDGHTRDTQAFATDVAPAFEASDAQRGNPVKIAVDILTEWRDVMTASEQRYSQTVFDALEVAALGKGLPKTLMQATKSHLAQASKMQIEIIDQMILDCQDKLEGSVVPDMHETQKSGRKNLPVQENPIAHAVTYPAQFWVAATLMWRKSWSDAMSTWAN